MESYIEPIRFAFLLFPIISFLFTLPYIFHQYHKYGSVLFRRVVIVYSFILYLTCIYFLVILPLPSKSYVVNLNTPSLQLTPFNFITEFLHKSSFVWDNPKTYLLALKEPYFYQVFYNVILTIPFGIYLRYYFNCSFKKTLGYSILLTIFFEITQLSGLYGIYERPYRLFDVDDLFLNTLGGIIGYILTPIFSYFLPERKELDQMSYRKGKKIPILRRGIAVWIDILFVLILTIIFDFIGLNNFLLQYIFSIIVVFMLIPSITKGFTFGKKFMNIRLFTSKGETPIWYQYWIRYGVLYLFLLPSPFYFINITLYATSNMITANYLMIVFVISGILCVSFFVNACISLFSKRLFWYERMSQTKNESTIMLEEENETNSEATM